MDNFLSLFSLTTIFYLFREELAVIENRILEKQLNAKRKAEKRAKNIAVSINFRYIAEIWMKKKYDAIGFPINFFTHQIPKTKNNQYIRVMLAFFMVA